MSDKSQHRAAQGFLCRLVASWVCVFAEYLLNPALALYQNSDFQSEPDASRVELKILNLSYR